MNATGTISFRQFCRAFMKNQTVLSNIRDGFTPKPDKSDVLRELSVDQAIVSEPPTATIKKQKTMKKKKG